MSSSLAFVALDENATLSGAAIRDDLAATWDDFDAIEQFDDELDQTVPMLSFVVHGAIVAIARMPAPIPWADLEGPCETSWLWPDAADALRNHTTHLIVTVSAEDLSPVERALLLTQVTASIVGTAEGVAGVYWGDATLVLPSGLFRDFAVDVLPDGLPALLWVDIRVGRNEDGTLWGFTTGLAALDLMEIETDDSTDSVGDLRERLISLSEYLLENGLVLRDGNTVGASESERIRVRWKPSEVGHEGDVIRLYFGTPDDGPSDG